MKKKKRTVKTKNKNFSFHHEVECAWKYLKESDNFIAVTFGFFVLFFMLGFVFIYVAPSEVLEPVLDQLREYIKGLVNEIEGKGFIEMWWFIFSNNASIGFVAAISGLFFGLIPAFFLLSNGLVIGLISGIVSREFGIFSLWQLLPHGVFEIPAIIISMAIGIKFGGFMFSKDPWKEFKFRFRNSLRVYFLIVIPLLVIAAIIEAALIVFSG